MGRGAGTRFGSGWISGVRGIVFSALAGGGVLCLLFPSWLTRPVSRPLYPLDVVRFLIYAFLVAGFGLGTLSVLLRRSKVLGVSALALATVTTLLGGSTTKVGALDGTPAYVGLDWFLLNVLVLSLIFIPMERRSPGSPPSRSFVSAGAPTSRISR